MRYEDILLTHSGQHDSIIAYSLNDGSEIWEYDAWGPYEDLRPTFDPPLEDGVYPTDGASGDFAISDNLILSGYTTTNEDEFIGGIFSVTPEGKVNWKTGFRESAVGGPVVDDDQAYIPYTSKPATGIPVYDTIYAVALSDGAVRWESTSVPAAIQMNSTAVGGGTLYIATTPEREYGPTPVEPESELHALDTKTGKKLWTKTLQGRVEKRSGVTVTDSAVYVTTNSKEGKKHRSYLQVLSPDSGQELTVLRLGQYNVSPPVVLNGAVILSAGSRVYGLSG